MSLYHQSTGTGEPPALLVHGTAAALWGELPGLLALTRRVISYDRRGFGRSDGPQARTLSEHTADAVGLLDELHVSRAVVVGWSIGGIIALELAARHPARVAGLVLIEPPLHLKRRPSPRLLGGLVGGILRGHRDPRTGAAHFLRFALRDTTRQRAEDALPTGWWEQMIANGPAIVHELTLGTGEHLTAADLTAIGCPTVVLHGDRSDPVFPRAARRTASAVNGAQVQPVTASGHVMQADRPDAIAAAIDAILPPRH